jgi:hypothetical protein
MNNIDFNISELADGAVQEKIDKEVRKIVQNILDVNTNFKPSRKLIIDVEFSSDSTRQVIETNVTVKSKIQPQESVSTLMMAGRDDAGYIQAAELKSSAPGQTYFDPSDSTLKTDTGIPVDEIEDGGVIDFNKRKSAN